MKISKIGSDRKKLGTDTIFAEIAVYYIKIKNYLRKSNFEFRECISLLFIKNFVKSANIDNFKNLYISQIFSFLCLLFMIVFTIDLNRSLHNFQRIVYTGNGII